MRSPLNSLSRGTGTPTAGLVLHDVARLLRRRFEQLARTRQLGMTRAQAAVLIHLSRSEGINQVSLAQLMELEPITLVRLLDRLQAAGFIERRPDPADRRAWRLYLTDAARPMLVKIEKLGGEIFEEAALDIDETDRATLVRVLSTMKLNLLDKFAEPADSAVRHAMEEAIDA